MDCFSCRFDNFNTSLETYKIRFKNITYYCPIFYNLNDKLKLQLIPPYALSSHHLLPAFYHKRNDLIKLLAYNYGIQIMVQYYPLYKQDLFKDFGYDKAKCPCTEKFFTNMLSFPFNVNMKDEDFEYIIESTKKALYLI